MICPACQRPIPSVRGGLMATDEPVMIYWRGIALDIKGAKARLMAALIQRGEVSHGMIEAVAGGYGSAKVHVCNLRRILRGCGVPVEIECVRGWGYRLAVSEA